MPTDPSSAPATATTRRRFLFQTAAGAAVLTTGVLGGPVVALVPTAGAQASTGLDDESFILFTAPLEMAAVIAYQAALDVGSLSSGYSDLARNFQSHHQEVADALTALLPATATPPTAALAFSGPIGTQVRDGGGQDGVLQAMAKMEEVLSATHLLALESLTDATTAQTAAQVLAIEAQQATVLARGGGADLATVTPAAASTDSALQPGDVAGAPPSDSADGSGSSTDSGSTSGDSGSGDANATGNKSDAGTSGAEGGGSSSATDGSNSGADGSAGTSGN